MPMPELDAALPVPVVALELAPVVPADEPLLIPALEAPLFIPPGAVLGPALPGVGSAAPI